MCGAIVTSPFDVVKTRLQSSMFRDVPVTINVKGTVEIVAQRSGGLLYHFVETGHILRWVLVLDCLTFFFKTFFCCSEISINTKEYPLFSKV